MELSQWILPGLMVIFLLYQYLTQDRSPIPETSGKVHKIQEAAELDTLLKSSRRVVVDFYADWCPPCRMIAPVFSGLADEHAAEGKLAFAKVNVDHVKGGVAARYGVTAMPTFVFFEGGAPAGEKLQGADPRKLKATVEALSEKK